MKIFNYFIVILVDYKRTKQIKKLQKLMINSLLQIDVLFYLRLVST